MRRHAARYGWALSDAYREEIRKLRALPSDLPAPALLWTVDDDIADVRWVILCLEYVDGSPPRRPWQLDELRLITDALARIAPLVAEAPRSIDAWLATLWLYFATSMELPVPEHSPHLGDHQLWYADATGDWLHHRLGIC